MSEINMTPMIDVMLVLLIIFMITAPLLTTGINVDLPSTSSENLPLQKDPIIITIDKANNIYIGEQKVAINVLADYLNGITKNNKSTTIYIKGDKKIKYDKVIQIIGELNNAGFSKISLVTKQ